MSSNEADYDGTGKPVVRLADDVPLYGGYNPANFDERDPDVFVTTLEDVSVGGGTVAIPSHAVYGADISNATVVDGFVINAGQGLHSAAFFNADNSSPTIKNNKIYGSSIVTTTVADMSSYGIVNKSSSSPIIQENTIDGGDPFIDGVAGTVNLYSYGIAIDESCNPFIDNNTISGGSPSVAGGSSTTSAIVSSIGIVASSSHR